MKKVLAMALSLALIATLAISGTVAYLTDEESQVNVMTVGKVDVELNELQRTDDKTALEEFEQGKVAMPYVDISTKDETFNLIKEDNHIDKIVYATNTGDSDAYMRILVAIPAWANTTDDEDNANDNNLHWNYPGDGTSGKIQTWLKNNKQVVFDESADQYTEYDFKRVLNTKQDGAYPRTTIGGKEYTVWAFTFTNPISAGQSTNIVMTGLFLDKRVDYDADSGKYLDINGEVIPDFDGDIYVPVLVQAVQTAGFKDATTALNAGYGAADTADEVAKWFKDVISTGAGAGVEYTTAGTYYVDKTIIFEDETGDNIVAAANEVVVNVKGGYYDTGSQRNNCAVWAYNGGTVNIYDGTFIADGDAAPATSAKHLDLIYAGQNGKINIYGGTFSLRNNNGWLLNCKDNTATITVYGGSFLNWNPANNESEGPNTNFVPTGYKVETKTTTEGTWYNVVKE